MENKKQRFLKRPIFWGVILFVIGVLGWFVSVIFAVVTLGKFRELANLFGVIALGSLPAALVWELARWFKKRREK